jgi:hypothetical protein
MTGSPTRSVNRWEKADRDIATSPASAAAYAAA